MPTSLLRPRRNTGECPAQRPTECIAGQDSRDPWSGPQKATRISKPSAGMWHTVGPS